MLACAESKKYEILRKLASGGMGEVYLARMVGIAGFAKEVVLKRIARTYADDPRWPPFWESVEDTDGNGLRTVDINRVDLWVLVDADGDLETDDDRLEFPVERYRVEAM